MVKSNPKVAGAIGELVAMNYLTGIGLYVEKANYHSRYGEIDIICGDEEYIVFAEVKLRNENSYIRGCESINRSKMIKIVKTACIYIQEYGDQRQPQFDALEITRDSLGRFKKLYHIKNAFSVEEKYAFF